MLALSAVMCSGLARVSNSAHGDIEFHEFADRLEALEQRAEISAPPEPPEASPPESPEPVLTIGGAVRLNYNWREFSEPDKDKVGDFGFELFRLDVNGEYGDLTLSAQYRWYAPFEAVHHAYVGYQLSPEWEAQLGIHQVPFGILPYASHSFWFGATYLLGIRRRL